VSSCLQNFLFTVKSLTFFLCIFFSFLFWIIAANEIAKEITTAESLQFDFGTIETATKKFSKDNKLGEGGFGEVYKVLGEHSFLDVLKDEY
jgi:hypothetical protein